MEEKVADETSAFCSIFKSKPKKEDQKQKEDAAEVIDYMQWFKDFNLKMHDVAVKYSQKGSKNRPIMTVNGQGVLVRKKSKDDPHARGARKFKI